MRDNKLSNRYGFDTTLNLRLFEHHNLSFFVGRNRTEYKQWNDVAYAFLTITIPEKNDFVSALYDQQQKSTRVTYIKDNQNRLFEPRLQGTVENNGTQQAGEVDVLVPTPYADMGGRVRSAHLIDEDQVLTRSSVRMNSSFVFAYDKGRWGGGISRPVPNSFVIFKPEPRLKGQKIALKSTSPFTEAQTGLFDEITFTNLLAYQYRDIQLDPSMMEVGRSLRKEKFILYPTYRSAHLIGLEERGAVILSGTMLNADGKPFALQVGKVSDKTFFTNRDGEFFIEGVEAGNYMMTIDGQEQQFPIKIDKNERGFKPLGTFIIERAE